MSWHKFVFSPERSYRYTRHLVFWLAWWLYFFGSRYFYPAAFISWRRSPAGNNRDASGRWGSYWDSLIGSGSDEFLRSLFMLSIHMIACYIIIYFLLSRYLLKAKYFSFLAGIILLGFGLLQASRFIDTTVIPFITKGGARIKIPYYASIFAGVINGMKVFVAAVAIKLAKHWWMKQREKERLDKEKIETELKLLKTQIHPQFLFNTLNNIYSFALTASPKAPEMLLKLSDILSYMLYECNDREVALGKEIKMLRDYMSLEKLRYGDKMEMNIQVTGDTGQDKIAPLLLLRFIENSFRQCSHRSIEQAWINLELQVENHVLDMKLMNGKTPGIEPETDDATGLFQAERRLLLLYPGLHTMKIREEPEIQIVNLQLQLKAIAVTGQAAGQPEKMPESFVSAGVTSKLPL